MLATHTHRPSAHTHAHAHTHTFHFPPTSCDDTPGRSNGVRKMCGTACVPQIGDTVSSNSSSSYAYAVSGLSTGIGAGLVSVGGRGSSSNGSRSNSSLGERESITETETPVFLSTQAPANTTVNLLLLALEHRMVACVSVIKCGVDINVCIGPRVCACLQANSNHARTCALLRVRVFMCSFVDLLMYPHHLGRGRVPTVCVDVHVHSLAR